VLEADDSVHCLLYHVLPLTNVVMSAIRHITIVATVNQAPVQTSQGVLHTYACLLLDGLFLHRQDCTVWRGTLTWAVELTNLAFKPQ
jgi:hypothetical protein